MVGEAVVHTQLQEKENAASDGVRRSHRSRAGWILGGSDLAEPLEVEHHLALSVRLESGDEAGSPDHLFVPVGVANVDRLEESIVESLNQNQKLGLLSGELFGRPAPAAAGLV